MLAPFSLVIFGGTGDLTLRRLIPGLYRLYRNNFFPQDFSIIGFSRKSISTADYRYYLFTGLSQRNDIDRQGWEKFVEHIQFVQGTFEDSNSYSNLKNVLNAEDKKYNRVCNKMLYLATPPQFYTTILEQIQLSSLSKKQADEWIRILIEKPFGKDLLAAEKLDQLLSQLFGEEQIYRVDHYLGKETVQNIIAFRFANGIFDPVWNKDYLDHVQITLAESGGIASRGMLYEGLGALRDVTQNHLMQLLATVVMEQPQSFSAEGLRNERAKAIQAIKCIDPNDIDKFVVRGQYESNTINQTTVLGYRQEQIVDKESNIETYVAMKLFVDTPRFSGVPFYLRTGKRLPKDVVEISLVFKQVCHLLFKEVGCPEEGNILTIRIQPAEGIAVRFIAKQPGMTMKLKSIDMDFCYREAFDLEDIVEAYDRILRDAFLGDQMLFSRSDELSASWKFIEKIIEAWQKTKPNFPNYKALTWGPERADELIERDGRRWILK